MSVLARNIIAAIEAEVIVNTEEQTLEECVNVILNRVLQTYTNVKTPII